MKLSNYFVLLLISVLATATAQAQGNYLPGSVNSLDGKQQTGLIDYREWRDNPRKIKFKQSETAEPVFFTVSDLKSFKIDGKDSFIRAVVNKDMTPVAMNKVVEDRQEVSVTDTVFLRILLKGSIVSLYEFNDEKLHYYISDGTEDYKELTYKVYYDNGVMDHRRTYRNELQKYVLNQPDADKIIRLLERADYREQDLVRAVAAINNVQVAKKKGSEISFLVEAGPALSSMKISGQGLINEFSPSSKPGFYAGVGMDITSTRNLKDFVFRLSLGYSSLKYESAGPYKGYYAGTTGIYTIEQSNITPALSVLYNFIRKPDFRLYLGGGFEYHITSYGKNSLFIREPQTTQVDERTMEDYYPLEKSWSTISGRIGTILNSKWEVAVTGKLLGGFERMSGVSVKPSIFGLRVGYQFGGKK